MNPMTIESEIASALLAMPEVPEIQVKGHAEDVQSFWAAFDELRSIHIEFKSRRAYEKLAAQHHVEIVQ